MKCDLERPLRLVSDKDQLFAEGQYPRPFAFNSEVARVFDDMVSRSVPLYRDVTASVAIWASRFYQPDSYLYDIGCSTGTTIEVIASHFSAIGRTLHAVGIDTSKPMLERAATKLASLQEEHRISLLHEDALDADLSHASVVVVNYTLQFIPVARRLTLLQKIYQGLRPGGLLYMSEKVRADRPEFQEMITFIYEDFKERQGYSRTEIERKKEALDNVLVPLSFHEQIELIKKAGFSVCEPLLKWNNFMTLVALKS